MQDDSRGYHIDLENLEIRIGGDCPDFLSAKTALVEYAKTRLVETERDSRIAEQNFRDAKSNFLRLRHSSFSNPLEFSGARARLIEADYALSVALKNHSNAHHDFIMAQQTKNPYEFQPYGDLGFAPHGPLTVLNFEKEGSIIGNSGTSQKWPLAALCSGFSFEGRRNLCRCCFSFFIF